MAVFLVLMQLAKSNLQLGLFKFCRKLTIFNVKSRILLVFFINLVQFAVSFCLLQLGPSTSLPTFDIHGAWPINSTFFLVVRFNENINLTKFVKN